MKRTSIKGLGEALFFEYDRQSDIPAAETGPLTQVPTFVHPDVAAPPIPDILTSISADVTAASPDVPTFGRPEALTPERPDIRTSAEDDERPDASWQIPLDMRKRLRAVLREERRISHYGAVQPGRDGSLERPCLSNGSEDGDQDHQERGDAHRPPLLSRRL